MIRLVGQYEQMRINLDLITLTLVKFSEFDLYFNLLVVSNQHLSMSIEYFHHSIGAWKIFECWRWSCDDQSRNLYRQSSPATPASS
ncbi:unnamed protein product [Ambrosiozyma monospora]|uniref:Unnamed protein product n=1 Tax=Ambrosiozyma monospora TaxID=43982 RepID=A0ACB5UD94_AMBMO|nr:unnamed protein product [Ambrosiozyma monospora]